MQKLIIPDVAKSKEYEVKKWICASIALCPLDLFVEEDMVDVEFWPEWPYANVSLFRSGKLKGDGTREYRDCRWEKQQQAIRDIFELYNKERVTWRWPHNRDTSNLELSEQGYILGTLFFIKKEYKSLVLA